MVGEPWLNLGSCLAVPGPGKRLAALLPFPSTLFVYARTRLSCGAWPLLSRKSPALVRQDENDEPSPPENLGGAYFHPNTPAPGILRVYCDDFVLVSEVRLRSQHAAAVFLKLLTLVPANSSGDEACSQILEGPVSVLWRLTRSRRVTPSTEQETRLRPGGRAVCKVLLAPPAPTLTSAPGGHARLGRPAGSQCSLLLTH